jgi:hypothetical protein
MHLQKEIISTTYYQKSNIFIENKNKYSCQKERKRENLSKNLILP